MPIDYNKLGKRIKEYRIDQGLSQEQLGKSVSVGSHHLSNIELGKKYPSLELLVEMANSLNVTADDLLVDSLLVSVSEKCAGIDKELKDCNETEKEIIRRTVAALKEILFEMDV